MATVVALSGAIAVAGCGLGAGSEVGDVELRVTRDYGARTLERSVEDVRESDTVMRVLDRNAKIETRFGGGFVESISGLSGDERDGRFLDWFFYVNGVESPTGAAEFELREGDRIWWDYRDWTAAMRVPAVVGSWPEPFAHGYEGERHPVELVCRAAGDVCGEVRSRLVDAGARLASGQGTDPIRVLVGAWIRIRGDDAAELIEDGPATSGVFADFERDDRGPMLVALDERGESVTGLRAGAGLVAATRLGDDPPTWVVTGTDSAGVRAAARALDADLRGRYAVALDHGREVRLP
jgi:hypothetical protein